MRSKSIIHPWKDAPAEGQLYFYPKNDARYFNEDWLENIPEEAWCDRCQGYVVFKYRNPQLICDAGHVLVTFKAEER